MSLIYRSALTLKGKGSPYSITVRRVHTHCIVYQRIRDFRDNSAIQIDIYHTIPFWSWSQFLAVTLQVKWIINPTVGCHYFPPGLQLPRNLYEGCYQFCCFVNRGTMGVNSLPKTVTGQHCNCDLNPGPSVPESRTLTTRLSSHHFDTAGWKWPLNWSRHQQLTDSIGASCVCWFSCRRYSAWTWQSRLCKHWRCCPRNTTRQFCTLYVVHCCCVGSRSMLVIEHLSDCCVICWQQGHGRTACHA